MIKPFITIKIGRTRFRKIFIDEILYCKADGSYSKIKTETKEYTLSKCLKEVEHLFENKKFVKINRTYIVNIDKCVELETSKNPELTLCNKEVIKPSALYINDLAKLFNVH